MILIKDNEIVANGYIIVDLLYSEVLITYDGSLIEWANIDNDNIIYDAAFFQTEEEARDALIQLTPNFPEQACTLHIIKAVKLLTYCYKIDLDSNLLREHI